MAETFSNARKTLFRKVAIAAIVVSGFVLSGASMSAGPAGPGPVKLDAGAYFACAFYPQDGNVNCFGVFPYETSPWPSPDGAYGERADYMGGDAIAFASGDWNNCVLLASGNTTCWGEIADEYEYSGGDAIGLAVAGGASCVLTSAHNVNCAGYYFGGGPWNEVYGGGDAEWVTMSSYAACIKKTGSNTLTCMGWNVTEPEWTPNGTPTPQAGGHYAMCMLMAEGTVDCMDNSYNEAGQTHPPAGLTGAIDLDGHFDRTCAALSNGDITCWGRNHPTSPATFQTWTYAGVGAVNVTVTDRDVCYSTATGTVACIRSTPQPYEGGGGGDDDPVDTDGDGVVDDEDAFPNDPSESADSDGDGVGNNADAFDNDPSESMDSDGDGVGNNADAFDNDPSETIDSDGDGVGNNADAFDNNPAETTDSDGDGVGNNADAFDNNPAETTDSDGDGVGNNADPFDNSNMSPNVMVGSCSPGVANKSAGGGATFNDLLAAAAAGGGNHGAYVSRVTTLSNGWKSAGLISGKEHGAITSCAARNK